MDVFGVLTAIVVAFGLLTTETVLRADQVDIHIGAFPKYSDMSVDKSVVDMTVMDQFNSIANVRSVVVPPQIEPRQQAGIGTAMAEALKIDDFGKALEADLGFHTDQLVFGFSVANGQLICQALTESATMGNRVGTVTYQKGEDIHGFVEDCANQGIGFLAPYSTSLYLLDQAISSGKGDFSEVHAIVDRTKAEIPPTPHSFERSLFENIEGLMALASKDTPGSVVLFRRAIDSDPNSSIPQLNLAFAYLEEDKFGDAIGLMQKLVSSKHAPTNKVLLSTAYQIMAAGYLGSNQNALADTASAKAEEINPDSSTGHLVRSEAYKRRGEQALADQELRDAANASDTLENYSEIAALYYAVDWTVGNSLVVNPFRNPLGYKFR